MQQATRSTKLGADPNPLDSTGLCLLPLDGRDVRGLSTLYILKGIMDRLNAERNLLTQCGLVLLLAGGKIQHAGL